MSAGNTSSSFCTAGSAMAAALSRSFSPCFAVGRTVGWTAHIIEQQDSGRLIRPQSEYNGPRGLEFVPIEKR